MNFSLLKKPQTLLQFIKERSPRFLDVHCKHRNADKNPHSVYLVSNCLCQVLSLFYPILGHMMICFCTGVKVGRKDHLNTTQVEFLNGDIKKLKFFQHAFKIAALNTSSCAHGQPLKHHLIIFLLIGASWNSSLGS